MMINYSTINTSTVMNNFSFYQPLSTFELPSNPLPSTFPSSPVVIPNNNNLGTMYPAPVFLLPQSSGLRI
ncbi:hypothetical protein [Halotia branconii]|uniref:Uncharacterized protein n=1 Tax=Halotia branconii CENA392 TaxID=1539056 RepID=A0AAJ6NP12_9CYAN|nr:hypothetical protein [Halotia branconii]WGV23918.1 hypothetical protein QI031_19175 [Halotia branconii CENA392]